MIRNKRRFLREAAFFCSGHSFVVRQADTLIFFGHDLRPGSSCIAIRPRSIPTPPSIHQEQPSSSKETPMREIVRPIAIALSVACLAASFATLSSNAALAQAKMAPAPAPQGAPPADMPIKQMAVTEKQVEGVISASKDMDAITDKLSENSKPDPKITAQLEAVAKKNGFASYDEYNNVVDNLGLVLAGVDPTTKKYVGAEAVIKSQIAEVQADKKMSAKDKKDALADLNDALKTPAPAIENKGNIDLVTKYYDKLAAIMGGGEQ
jgi:hypothetical protein